MLPQPGRYTVTAPERSVYESKGGALVFSAKCLLEDGCTITAYQTLVLKDGTLSEMGITTLREVFGWDGHDPMWLQDEDLGGMPFDITVEPDTDQKGQPTVRVTWINPVGAGGGTLQKGDRKAILAKFGAKFRALAGGGAPAAARPVPPAPAVKPRPVPPPLAPISAPKPPPAASPSPNPAVAGATMEDAWRELCCAPGAPKDHDALASRWQTLVAEVCGENRPATGLTPADWANVKAAAVNAWMDPIPT